MHGLGSFLPPSPPQSRGEGRKSALGRAGDEDDAEAEMVAAGLGLGAVAVGAAAAAAIVIPRPAPQYPAVARGRALRVDDGTVLVVEPLVAVGAPLPDVAVHVMKPPDVGGVGADRGGVADGGPELDRAVRVAAVEVGLVRRQRRAEGEGRGGAGAAGVLPLGLGRQTV